MHSNARRTCFAHQCSAPEVLRRCPSDHEDFDALQLFPEGSAREFKSGSYIEGSSDGRQTSVLLKKPILFEVFRFLIGRDSVECAVLHNFTHHISTRKLKILSITSFESGNYTER